MARPIAYNASGPLSGSIRGGSVNYTIDGAGRDYTTFAGKKWVPSADGAAPIVFVTDSFTRGLTTAGNAYPLFFSCAGTGSAAIIYTANRLPGSPGNYSDANVALSDLITARGYFILESNDPYQGDDADGLAFDIDASKMSSYPQTGTNWRDLSGNNFITALINGPTFQTGGWFNLDGTDDRIQRTSNILTTTTGTVVMWLRTTDQTWLMIEGNTNGYYLGAIYLGGAWYNNACGSPSYFVDTKSSTNPTSEGYIDGRFHMFEAKNVDLSGWTTHQFLDYNGGGTFNMVGDVAKIQMYNKNLTAAESKQNYFGAPIVTNGLVFGVDANNIVSYPKSGTSAYSLTGSITNTLVNGVGYSLSNGGSFSFDGTDDYISGLDASFMNGATEGTFEAWINTNSITQGGSYSGVYDIIIGKASGPDNAFGFNSSGYLLLRLNSVNTSGNTIVNLNSWNHVVGTWNSTNVKIYLNGVLDVDYASAGRSWEASVYSTQIGRMYVGSAAGSFTGKIANTRVYNRALSASEVLQNYQSEQYRFEGPAGIPTNGLQLWLDAGNLDSYPGTGTTWYDLSSQGNHMTLVNGPIYNQTNGGVIIFDGIDDYAQRILSNCSTSFKTMTEYTVVSVFQSLDPTTDWNCLWGFGDGDGNVDNWQQAGSRYFGSDNQYLYTTVDLYTAGINMWAQTFTSGDNKIYRNNTLNTSNAATTITNPSTAAGFVIATNSNGFGYPTKMNMNLMLIYNRVLTTTELTQIYNYYKGRFGL
jgi:hypothetical protein